MHVLATQLKMLYVSETKQNGNEIKINTKLEQNTCSHKNGNYSIVKKSETETEIHPTMEITCTVPLNSHMQITDSNLDIPRPEEELPVEIRLFNDIHVSDDDVSIWADTDTHHSPVL